MILPNNTRERHIAFRNMIRQCELNSRESRRTEADMLARWYELGGDEQAEYNLLDEKVTTSAALSFDPQSVRLEVTLPKRYGDEFVDELEAARDDLEGVIETDLAVLAMAVEWGHVWPSTFVKVFGRDEQIQAGMLADPSDFGTAHEDLTLDKLPYFTHWYTMTISQFERRIVDHPRYAELMNVILSHATAPDRPTSQSLPPTLLISQSSPTMIGAVNQMPEPRAQAVVREPVVKLAELWWYDSNIADYRIATEFIPTLDIVWETLDNPIGLPGEHAFRQLCLRPKPGYLYGRSLLKLLIPLQRRRTDVLKGIYNLNDLNLDPPIFFDGFPGLIDETGERFMKPGGRKSSPMPGASAKPMAPPMPPDAFAVVREIDTMASRMWGLPQAFSAGEAQPNVRSGMQESELATLGSPVLLQRATRVAEFASSVLSLKLRMRQKDLATPLRREAEDESDDETKSRLLLLSLMPAELRARIWGNSSSPVAASAIERKALMLLQSQAISGELFADMVRAPFMERVRRDAKRMAKVAAQYKGIAMQIKQKDVDAKMLRAQAQSQKALTG